MSTDSSYLLFLSCSGTKRADQRQLPAIERYQGVNYLVLRKALRNGFSPPNLNILILSAKYGLLRSGDLISDYDQLMTRRRAFELQKEVGEALDAHLSMTRYARIFVNLGQVYLIAVAGSTELEGLGDKVTYAHGGIGQRMAQMKQWLLLYALLAYTTNNQNNRSIFDEPKAEQ